MREEDTAMAHDAKRTADFIDDAMRRFILYRDPVDRNYRAFKYLRGTRRRGDEDGLSDLGITVTDDPNAPFDVDLADAEHYMYARLLASQTGDVGTKALVTGYQLMKMINSLRGKEQDMRTNPKFPVLPASTEAVKWGLKGVDDGLKEYRDAHGGKLGKVGSAFKANEDFIRGQLAARGAGY